jgi:hypothetical protein
MRPGGPQLVNLRNFGSLRYDTANNDGLMPLRPAPEVAAKAA